VNLFPADSNIKHPVHLSFILHTDVWQVGKVEKRAKDSVEGEQTLFQPQHFLVINVNIFINVDDNAIYDNAVEDNAVVINVDDNAVNGVDDNAVVVNAVDDNGDGPP